jgi:hypothetical protein
VAAPQYVHPESNFSKRVRRGCWLFLACLALAGVVTALMNPSGARPSSAAATPVDHLTSNSKIIPTTSPAEHGAVDSQLAIVNDARPGAAKAPCIAGTRSDGSCVSFQLPKVRMVRVAKPHAESGTHKVSVRSGVATALGTTKLDKVIAEPKKAQRSAHRHNHRRNAPATRGHAASGRGAYGGQAVTHNFW